jgi:hypothetical protein
LVTDLQILGAKIRAAEEEFVVANAKPYGGGFIVPSREEKLQYLSNVFGISTTEISYFLTWSRSCTHPWSAGACEKCPEPRLGGKMERVIVDVESALAFTSRLVESTHDYDSAYPLIAARDAAIRREAFREAAEVCRRMVVGGRAWTHEQAVAADALFAAAENIEKLLADKETTAR